MDKLFGDKANDIFHSADNIMVATDGPVTEYLSKLLGVLQCHKEGNIKIVSNKLKIAQTTVEFFGVIWRKDTISL